MNFDKKLAVRPEVRAGRAAELGVAAILRDRFRGTCYEFVAGVRVPFKKGRREIDFVITSVDEVWLVELKNWSGFVGFEDRRVIQHRAGGRGVVDHGRVLANCRTKEGALKAYLKRETGEDFVVRNFVVFCNEKVGISEELMGVEDVIVARLREFLSVLPAARADYGWLGRVFRGIFGGGGDKEDRREPVSEAIVKAREALGRLGSWDFLVLRGGRVVSGDLKEIGVEGVVREEMKSMDVVMGWWRESKVMVRDRSGEVREVLVGGDEEVVFHGAGQSSVERWRLWDVVGVVVS